MHEARNAAAREEMTQEEEYGRQVNWQGQQIPRVDVREFLGERGREIEWEMS